MAFGIAKATQGDFLPIVKYSATDGRITRRDRIASSQGFVTEEEDITDKFSAVMDFDNIQTGWMAITPEGPRKVFSRYLKDPIPERPADKDKDGKPIYKQGIGLTLLLGKSCRRDESDDGLREFSGNSGMLVEAIGMLHDEFMEFVSQPENRGKLPIVKFEGARKEDTKYGKFYRPRFAIDRWVDRPEALMSQGSTVKANGNGAKADGGTVFSSAPNTGSTVKPPPMAKTEKLKEPASADDFG